MALLLPMFMRGLAQLQLRQATEAAQPFTRLRELRGVDPFSVCYALAPLGAARARALAGDTTAGRGAYEQFLREWQGADEGVPLLREARNEFERMKRSASPASAQ